LLDSHQQLRKTILHGPPNKIMPHVLVIVPVDVSGTCNITPRDMRVARFEVLRQSARCFRDDLEASCDGIEYEFVATKRIIVNLFDEFLSQIDVVPDVDEGT